MKITINDEQTIAEIREAFNRKFPFLKLEFFSKRHFPGHPSPLKFVIKPATALKDCRKVHNAGEIAIRSDMKVNELEQLFWTDFGLGVQVFRKSGNIWLETVLTDTWSLDEQNKEGEQLSNGTSPDAPEYYLDRD